MQIIINRMMISIFVVLIACLKINQTQALSTAVTPLGCGGKFNGTSGIISSPQHPGTYPPNSNCTWFFKVESGYRVQIWMETFDVEYSPNCVNDYIEIKHNEESKSFCGEYMPVQTSSTNQVSVIFRADDQNQGTGFSGNWTAIKSDDIPILLSASKPTNQSSTFSIHQSDLAVDGIEYIYNATDTCSKTSYSVDPWWLVDLQQASGIQYVDIVRSPSDLSFAETEVKIGMSPNFYQNPTCTSILSHNVTSLKWRVRVECDYPLLGRYVSVQIVNSTARLQLCEVMVYGYGLSRNTSTCSYSPGPCDNDATCMTIANSVSCECDQSVNNLQCSNGRCVPLEYTCNGYDNCGDSSDEQLCDPLVLSDQIHTEQSSTYIDKGNGYVAALAIDGSTGHNIKTCTHSRMESEPWWMLDLGKTYDIRYVDIINRGGFEERLNGAEVGIGMSRKPVVNPRCGPTIDDAMTSVCYEFRVDCARFMHGRFITVQLTGIRQYLTICEVILFGYEYPRIGDGDVCSYSPGPCDVEAHDCLMTSSDFSSCNCTETSFECENGRCIPNNLRCNNYDNCGDASDEMDCSCDNYDKSCNPSGTGLCVPERWSCDGFESCDNGNDELFCYCGEGNFECSNGRCIDAVQVCDLIDDCGTNEDEDGCVICPDGVNVPASRVCDGRYDCANRTDETNCDDYQPNTVHYPPTVSTLSDACSDIEFECGNRECIHEIYQCDGQIDCRNDSDEKHCSDFCDADSFSCNSETCISLSFRCDFIRHCMNGADENNCFYRNCTSDEFKCGNGQCIHQDMRCDFIQQCTDGTDEVQCTGCDFGFQCYDGTCIPSRLRCDGTKDCPGSVMEDEYNCGYWDLSACALDELRCKNGECVTMDLMCVYDVDVNHLSTGCRDSTHLENCTDMECPSGTVKCPRSYCIAKHLQCNTVRDCPNGEDEIECESYECPGMFRCHKSQVCVSPSQMCNGIAECPEADDEMFCNLTCPTGCTCVGLSVICHRIPWDNSMAKLVPTSTRYLSVSNVESQHVRIRRSLLSTIEDVLKMDLTRFQMLISLNLSSNGIEAIAESTFVNQMNLDTLVLSGNRIKRLEAGCFDGLNRLTTLFIDNNELLKIGPGVLIDAPIVSILHMENNRLEDFESKMFEGLILLNNLYTDDFQFCCMLPEATHCEPPPDIFSSCEDLMRISFLRVMMWILGLSALVGNAFVIVWRVRDLCSRNVQSFLITNLAISDFLMGVYMIIIASADVHYRGHYAVFATVWRSSFLCRFAGALSMTSSEFSVFTLVIISLDRAISVGFPFSHWKITRKKCYVIVIVGWFVAVAFGFLPIVGIPYFGDNFYGRPSVCLALPLTNEHLSGWEYSVAIVLGLNLLCFLIIAISYIYMFAVVKKTAASAQRNVANRTDVKMATKMAMIIFTDFCCWFPIIIMGIIAQTGSWEIPVDVYVWSATLILPINASLNPYLYTIFWINDAKKRKRKKLTSIQLTERSNTRSTVTNSRSTPSFAVVFDSNACDSKNSKLTTDRKLSKEQITDVGLELKRTLQFMHGRHIYHGHVTGENIIIYEEKGKIRSCLLTKNALYDADDEEDLISRDLEQLSTFLKALGSGMYNKTDAAK